MRSIVGGRVRRVKGKVEKANGVSAFRLDPLKSNWNVLLPSLPRSLSAFAALLFITFAVMFAWAFIEPSFMYYAYDDLAWL